MSTTKSRSPDRNTVRDTGDRRHNRDGDTVIPRGSCFGARRRQTPGGAYTCRGQGSAKTRERGGVAPELRRRVAAQSARGEIAVLVESRREGPRLKAA